MSPLSSLIMPSKRTNKSTHPTEEQACKAKQTRQSQPVPKCPNLSVNKASPAPICTPDFIDQLVNHVTDDTGTMHDPGHSTSLLPACLILISLLSFLSSSFTFLTPFLLSHWLMIFHTL